MSFWLTLPPGVDMPSDAVMVWKWGDGNQSAALAVPFSGPGPSTWSTSYEYSAPGDYIVQLVISNLASSVTFTVSVSHVSCSFTLLLDRKARFTLPVYTGCLDGPYGRPV